MADVVEKSINRKGVMFFAATIQHANEVMESLPKGRSAIVTGKTKPKERRDIVSKFKSKKIKYIVNVGTLTTGFDAPKTNTAVIARPTNSLTLFSQMVGRATRGIKAGGNKECDIYVINDALPGFRDMAQAFSHWDDAWNEEDLEND